MTDYIPVDPTLERDLQHARQTVTQIFAEVGRHIIGQDQLRRRLMTALITDGHVLLEGVPGLAKTLSIKAFAGAVDASFRRIQFTPDLLPSDIIGTEVFRPQDGRFEIRRGPIFANFVLADEINRAPAKVQSALLETMQEKQVTIGGETLRVPEPFFVLATQNPIEQEGTYPLPEAQVDRFMMKVRVGYPSAEQEKQMLDLVTQGSVGGSPGGGLPAAGRSTASRAVATLDDIRALREVSGRIYVDERVKQYIVRLVHASRRPKEFGLDIGNLIELGASPRAVIALFLTARAEAVLDGMHFVLPQMVKDVAADVLRHRILLTYEAEAQGIDADAVVKMILDGVEVP